MSHVPTNNDATEFRPRTPSYAFELLEFLDGRRDWHEWKDWLETHRAAIAKNENPKVVTELERSPDHGAMKILERWAQSSYVVTTRFPYCPDCGAELFVVLPGSTTESQIRDFASTANLEGREEMVSSGWIHPGRYCKCGYAEMWNLGR